MARRRRKQKLPPLIVTMIVMLGIGVSVVGCQAWQNRQTAEDITTQTNGEETKAAFIKRLAPYAQQLHQTYGVYASITLAQAILESDWGQSTLAKDYHNLFGIKSNDPANSQVLTTQEYVNDQWVTIKARFAVYPSDQASMKAHALLFVNGTNWNPAQYQTVLKATTYQAAAQALKTDGYATDPDYPNKLINLIKQWQLDQYD
ncbi:glycoside hydrolase family 73 protein [Lacticaseibacillus baoqingensis]|uniref:Glycoside hydrolase family 73 protein n=1 Tax=Lacticaseibacillus baoqingensis TaxID=2486013 RepID=A0ABW4E3S2_9LACO|nr:glycoside hydrolase family 73 protein [Lacticaseibacillus baoqingensis]